MWPMILPPKTLLYITFILKPEFQTSKFVFKKKKKLLTYIKF